MQNAEMLPFLQEFRQEFLTRCANHQHISVELANKNQVPEMEKVLQDFIVFMQDEVKWQKVLRMYERNQDVEIYIRGLICSLNVSFNKLPLLKQLMTTNELINRALQASAIDNNEVNALQIAHLNQLITQLNNFLTFVENNLRIDTDKLSSEIVSANEHAATIQEIYTQLAPYPKDRETFALEFERYSQVHTWLGLMRQLPPTIDQWLSDITTSLSSLGQPGALPKTYILTALKFSLKRLFFQLEAIKLPAESSDAATDVSEEDEALK